MASQYSDQADFYKPGTIMHLSKSFNYLPRRQQRFAGLSWEAGKHPFLILRTYGPNGSHVLGCSCSTSFKWKTETRIPISGPNRWNNPCEWCTSFPNECVIRNAKHLAVEGPPQFHTHISFAEFAIIETRHLSPFSSDMNQPKLTKWSMEWVTANPMVQYRNEIEKAEQKLPLSFSYLTINASQSVVGRTDTGTTTSFQSLLLTQQRAISAVSTVASDADATTPSTSAGSTSTLNAEALAFVPRGDAQVTDKTNTRMPLQDSFDAVDPGSNSDSDTLIDSESTAIGDTGMTQETEATKREPMVATARPGNGLPGPQAATLSESAKRRRRGGGKKTKRNRGREGVSLKK